MKRSSMIRWNQSLRICCLFGSVVQLFSTCSITGDESVQRGAGGRFFDSAHSALARLSWTLAISVVTIRCCHSLFSAATSSCFCMSMRFTISCFHCSSASALTVMFGEPESGASVV